MSNSSSKFVSGPTYRLGCVTGGYGLGGGLRVTVQRLKYSRIISSREANRMGRFQYPGDSKSPSKRVSSLIMSSISRRDFVGGVGVVVFDLENVLYFCFASTYLYRKSRSIHATANATISASPTNERRGWGHLQWLLQCYSTHMHMPSELMDDMLRH